MSGNSDGLGVDLVLGTESLIRYAEESPRVPQETLIGVIDRASAVSDLPTDPSQIATVQVLAGDVVTEQLVSAIWPASPTNQLDGVVVGLSQNLGSQFQLSDDGRYRLRSVIPISVRRWLAQARGMTNDRARNLLQLALSEVRCRPFPSAAHLWSHRQHKIKTEQRQ